jgi:hypothetical protein
VNQIYPPATATSIHPIEVAVGDELFNQVHHFRVHFRIDACRCRSYSRYPVQDVQTNTGCGAAPDLFDQHDIRRGRYAPVL